MVLLLTALSALVLGSIPQADVPHRTVFAPSQNLRNLVFRSAVNLGRVDVLVLDREHCHVTDVAQEKFQIFEGGKRNDVALFAPIELPMPPPLSPHKTYRAVRASVPPFNLGLRAFAAPFRQASQNGQPVPLFRQAAIDLDDLLARAAKYLARYLEDFSAVVAEETYEQTVGGSLRGATLSRGFRRLRSDFLLVLLPGEPGWTPFRDVFEVDGEPVRDHDDRLRQLFLDMPPDALTTARRILDEGARYNIGKVHRNINQPLLPLIFLLPENLARFQFTRKGADEVEGVRVWRVDYVETGRPTVVRQAESDLDMPSSGSLWIDPVTGRVVKTLLETSDGLFRMETTVLYRPNETLGLWTPAEMRETYTSPGERIYGKATYQNFRRFQVKTEMTIKVPKED